MSANSHLDTLNPQQRQAALHKDGPLLIVAGAGAGKTKTIAHRILNLIGDGVPPEQILAITFTNKAAREMKERVASLLDESRFTIYDLRKNTDSGFPTPYALRPTPFPFISTFHALGVQLIKENASVLGTTRYFSILDKNESLSLIKRAIKELGLNTKEEEPNKLQAIISREKNHMVTVDEFARKEAGNWYYETAIKVWRRYQELLSTTRAFDFDDLILRPVLLFQANSDVLERYQNRWRYLHIDEYQDTNVVQYELSRMLAQKHKNICAVGDFDQSIYGWRGADSKNILNFEHNFPGAKIVTLEENYRSTNVILHAANEVIKKNKLRREKNLFTRKEGGEKIALHEAFDEADEAERVAKKIAELLRQGVSAGDCAVLYRANFQSRALEETLPMRGVPYQVLGTKFYDRKEVRDVLAYMRAALNTEDGEAFARIVNVPPRGIGTVTLEKIVRGREHELAEKMRAKLHDFRQLLLHVRKVLVGEKLSIAIKQLVRLTGIEKMLLGDGDEGRERLENLKELVTIATKYDIFNPEEAVQKFLTDTALMSEQDSLKEKGSGVKLMTVHAAKGLEFRHVFITGLEEGLFPHQRLGGERSPQEEVEEERRLFYVALTRAKEKLHLSYAMARTIFGVRRTNIPSSFLGDIPDASLEFKSSVSNPHNAQDAWQEDSIVWQALKNH